MGTKPRLGGEGRLVLPTWLTVTTAGSAVNDAGDIIGDFGREDCDPFERRSDGLLLTESFARLDLSRPRKARTWMLENGVLDFDSFYPDERDERGYSGEFEIQDPSELVMAEQQTIRWYLGLLARLTATLPPPAGDGVVFRPEWYPAELAARHGMADLAPHPRFAYDLALFEIGPRVERALAPSVIVRGARLREGPSAFPDTNPFSVIPIVQRRWSSILGPIYLQIYEALRRVSEVRPAARLCRECGQPFLVLDGRRIAFCNDLERARFNQRRYRERKVAQVA